jgi:hypothetical protein
MYACVRKEKGKKVEKEEKYKGLGKTRKVFQKNRT